MTHRKASLRLAAALTVCLLAFDAYPTAEAHATANRTAERRATAPDRATITDIQEQLKRRGFDPGAADGHVGARTRKAIRDFQRASKLPVDGRLSRALLEALTGDAPPAEAAGGESAATRSKPDAAPAANGLVGSIQRELQVRGYYNGAIDGDAGPNTKAAVRAFQRDAGFPVTGDLDQRLLVELRIVDRMIKVGPRN